MATKVKNNFYSVAWGRTNGIFTDCSNCEISVHKFNSAVYKGFQTLEQVIHFMLASKEYNSCHEIPVHDLDRVIKVSDLGHQCTTACAPCNTSFSDSEVEDTEVVINIQQHEGLEETDAVLNQWHDYANSENTEVKTVAQADRSMSICTYCQESSAESYDII